MLLQQPWISLSLLVFFLGFSNGRYKASSLSQDKHLSRHFYSIKVVKALFLFCTNSENLHQCNLWPYCWGSGLLCVQGWSVLFGMYYWLGESNEFDFILLVFCQYFQHEIYDEKIRMLNFFISDIHLSPILQVYLINFCNN